MVEAAAETVAEAYAEVAGDALRMVAWYEGNDYDTVSVRDDVREMYTPGELDEKIKQLAVVGASDPPAQDAFRLFGTVDAVVRLFESVTVLHFPLDEFAGVAVTLDRGATPSLDELLAVGRDHLDAQ